MMIMHKKKLLMILLIVSALSLSACKSKHLKAVGALIVVGIAAKVIYDMIIESRSEQTRNDLQVVNNYQTKHQALPENPQLLQYHSSIEPSNLVSAGNPVSITSTLEVVRGQSSETVSIQEKIVIYDNVDPNKELKSLVKTVNEDSKKCGAFKNQFSFTLPKGMPQGVYPIKTFVIVDGQELPPIENKMQLVEANPQFNSQRVLIAPSI